MMDLSTARSAGLSFLKELRRFRLTLACVAIVLCFVLCNDVYGATTAERRGRRLTADRGNAVRRERVLDYSEMLRQSKLNRAMLGASEKQYLVDPNSSTKPNLMRVLTGNDTCPSTAQFAPPARINAFPFLDSGTTEPAVDNYNIQDGLIENNQGVCPNPTCAATNGTSQYPDRGYAYIGTGDGPDVAYRITFGVESNMKIDLHPLDMGTTEPGKLDDMALIVYGGKCGNSSSDVVVMADNEYPRDNPGQGTNDETITITKIPRGHYHIVIDGYSYANQTPKSAGPYELRVDCATAGCAPPVPQRARRTGV